MFKVYDKNKNRYITEIERGEIVISLDGKIKYFDNAWNCLGIACEEDYELHLKEDQTFKQTKQQ